MGCRLRSMCYVFGLLRVGYLHPALVRWHTFPTIERDLSSKLESLVRVQCVISDSKKFP